VVLSALAIFPTSASEMFCRPSILRARCICAVRDNSPMVIVWQFQAVPALEELGIYGALVLMLHCCLPFTTGHRQRN
jgi:hypothetical protein